MGLLRRVADGFRHPLRARHLVGRSPTSDLVLPRREVSSEQAKLRWTGRAWEIRDLGSRNGTWVNEEKLGAGDQRELVVGATVAFGTQAEVWRLEDASAPVTCAVPVAGGPVRAATNELLALPDDESPVASVYPAADGRWVLETGGAVEPVTDGEVVDVDGRAFQIFLAAPVELTLEPSMVRVDISLVKLRFFVSRDEEHVSLTVVSDGVERSLGSRSFHYLLLTLARQRLKDELEPELPASAHGWVYQDDLMKKLPTDANKFGVDVFRARRQLLDAGVEGAAQIVERRSLSRQLRIGVANLEVIKE
jgi:hypothetical protein